MQSIEAVFSGGVFKPLGDVNLPENARVHLQVQPIAKKEDVLEWLRGVQEMRQKLFEEHGYFPDSAIDIAEDRRR
ncbi:MAG: antitoxin family protein [Gemmataceae bacterium]|nr:antitoxin family protein [Gemmataceae bacterium]